MKQKLALACTLVHEPQIILLDEPTTGVDPVSRREFWKLLSEFLAQGITILMATPYLDEAERCSQVALLHEGALLALDTPGNLRNSLPGDVMEVIAGDRDRVTRMLERLPGVADVQLFGERAHVRLPRGSPLSDPARLDPGAAGGGDSNRQRPAGSRLAGRCLHRFGREDNDMRCALLALVCFLSSVASVHAQGDALRLTLPDAIARGLETSHRIAELSAREQAARAMEDQREAATRPSIAVVASYTRTNHVEEFSVPTPSGGLRVIYPDIPDNVRSRLDLQWPIYTGGRLQALDEGGGSRRRRKRPGPRIGAGGSEARDHARLLGGRHGTRLPDVLRQALERTNAHLVDVRNQLNVGLVPPSDVLSIEAQQARQRMLPIESDNLVEIASADLRRLTGLPPDAPFELGRARPSARPVSGRSARVARSAGGRGSSTRESARPQGVGISRRCGGERVAAASAGRLPVLTAIGGYDLARPNPRIFPIQGAWKPSWDLGVNVRWPVFDGGRVRAEAAESVANQRTVEARLRELDASIDAELRQRAAELRSSQAAIEAAHAGVRAATEARRVLAERFAAGVATNTDVLAAQVALLQAELDRTRALANAKLAAARLDRVLGR